MNTQQSVDTKLNFAIILLCIFLSFSAAFQPTTTSRMNLFSINRPVPTRQFMVADVPEATVEEATTQTLLDQILDESLRTNARRPIMMPFDPSSKAIWRHWKGTVFAETWRSTVKHIIWAFVVFVAFKRYPQAKTFFDGFSEVWLHSLSMTTFTLSFFLNQAYTLWRSCLTISRTLQGRINDLMLMLAAHAQRIDPADPDDYSTFTPKSAKMLQIVSRHLRLFNILAYGSFTRSYRPLLTPQGMRRMVARGLMTEKERRALVRMNVAATQRFNAVLAWIFRTILEARKAGLLEGGFGFEQQVITKVQEVRAQANSMESELRGRMPFAYAHVVQIMVDATLWLYPIAAFTQDRSVQLGIIATAMLTIAYKGLFDLSKQFLDPYHNENFWKGEDALVIDTLIAETNSGSLRWMYALDEMPIPQRSFKSGKLDDHILPDEGYTKKEALFRAELSKVREAEKAGQLPSATPQEYAQQTAKMLEAYQDEYAEAQLILNAPPASDFVPGLDDEGDSMVEEVKRDGPTNSTEQIDSEFFERFVDATEEEFQDLKVAVDKDET